MLECLFPLLATRKAAEVLHGRGGFGGLGRNQKGVLSLVLRFISGGHAGDEDLGRGHTRRPAQDYQRSEKPNGNDQTLRAWGGSSPADDWPITHVKPPKCCRRT